MRIFKYPFTISDEVIINIPGDATILTIQEQYGEPCLWALVDPDKPKKPRVLRIIGTGHPIPDVDTLKYLGTIQMAGGGLIWHIFEKV